MCYISIFSFISVMYTGLLINATGSVSFLERCIIKYNHHNLPQEYFYCNVNPARFLWCYVNHTPWLTCSWKSIGRIVPTPYGKHIVYRWITEHERSIVPDFQPTNTRSVLCSAVLPDDLHFVRRIDRRFGSLTCTLHRSVYRRLISRDKKKQRLTVTKCLPVNFVQRCPLQYLVNRMTSYSITTI